METVGAAASIIQLASVGLTLAKALYSLYDEVSSGNKQAKQLSFFARSTPIALDEVGKVFEEESRATNPLIYGISIATAKDVIFRCTEIFYKLGEMAQNGQKKSH